MDTYDFSAKHLYRQRRESAIDRLVGGSFKDRRVAYLDTGEALDTISYLRRGYKAKNLWPVNHNPAEVATLSRKLKSLGFPEVNTVGLDFEDALTRRIPEVSILDFDGMSCLHDDLVRMLNRVVLSRRSGVLAVTMLGGRESSDRFIFSAKSMRKKFPNDPLMTELFEERRNRTVLTPFGTQVKETHHDRVATLLYWVFNGTIVREDSSDSLKCLLHVRRIFWDVYTSTSGQPMVWCVIKYEPHKHLTPGDAVSIFKSVRAGGILFPPWCKHWCQGHGPVLDQLRCSNPEEFLEHNPL